MNTDDILTHYKNELMTAKSVQQALLAAEHPRIEDIDISSICIAADNIGGDFYTFVQKEYRSLQSQAATSGIIEFQDSRDHYLGIAIGDVAGHGVGSALIMALASGIIKEAGLKFRSPGDVLQEANRAIAGFIKHSHISYVTAFYVVLNLTSLQLKYAKAGHPPALLHRSGQDVKELNGNGVFLGMFDDEVYEEYTIQLKKGDRLLLYTDGITEARNSDGEQFGDHRLHDLFQQLSHCEAQHIQSHIITELTAFTDKAPVRDDQTLVILGV